MLHEAISDAQGGCPPPLPAVNWACTPPCKGVTLKPWVSQTKITIVILCRQVKAAEVAACRNNSRSQDHEKEGYDRVFL